MATYEECRRRADGCVKLATATDDDGARRTYLEMAEEWLRLALNAPDRPAAPGDVKVEDLGNKEAFTRSKTTD